MILRTDASGNYPGCVNNHSPATSSPTLTINSPTGLLACSPLDWAPSWTVTSPTLTVANVCTPIEADGLPGPTIISSPALDGALFFCGESAEIKIYSADGRLAYLGQLQKEQTGFRWGAGLSLEGRERHGKGGGEVRAGHWLGLSAARFTGFDSSVATD